ncbi:hypothetical protein Tco_0968436 [Tanacetum coccineum]
MEQTEDLPILEKVVCEMGHMLVLRLKPSGRHSRLINEFDQVAAEAGESLTSVYERFSTTSYNEAPQIVSSLEEPNANEPTTLVSDDTPNESIQQDT